MFAILFSALVLAEPLGFEAALAFADTVPEVEADRRAAEARGAFSDEVSRVTFNPLVQVQPGLRRTAAGTRGGELYVSLLQRFSLTGAGKQRRAAVRAEHDEDRAMVRLARVLARRRIAQAWFARWAAQTALREAEAEVQIARELAAQVERTTAAGEATRVDLAAVQTWAAEAELFALAGEGESFETGVALAQALGRVDALPQPATDAAPDLALPATETLLGAGASTASSAEVRVALRAAESEGARLEEVRAVRGPTFALGGMGWREGTGDVAGVGTLEVEIPVFERGARERAAQAAASARAEGRVRTVERGEQARRVRLVHELEHTREVLDVLSTRFMPAAQALADGQAKRFIAREATAQDWVLARQKLLRVRMDAVRARAAHSFARFLVAEAARETAP